MSDLNLIFRWLIRRDLPEVLQIEQECNDPPWDEEQFLCCLRQRNCIGMVAEHNDQVIGFIVYELIKNRLKIVNLAVPPLFQRQGVGAALIERLKSKIAQQRRKQIELEIRETSLDGQLFFKDQGFLATELLLDHFCFAPHFQDEDGYLMRWTLPLDDQLPVNRAVEIEE